MMVGAEATSYELPRSTVEASSQDSARPEEGPLSAELLLKNALWFCRLRWVVVAAFVAFGVLEAFGGVIRHFGLSPQGNWPFVVAGVLAACNLIYLVHEKLLSRSGKAEHVVIHLWGQIVMDLVILTVVVHFIGSRETFIVFGFLFHIVLACIFFSGRQSLVVAVLACALYAACLAAEATGKIPTSSIYVRPPSGGPSGSSSLPAVLNMVSAMGIMLVVWYLGSHLSSMVRVRDRKLARTNRRLVEALEERARHMLQTTHELKAPFAAINAGTQALLGGHCGPLTDDSLDVISRISSRCRGLASEIQEMLQLANLSSASQQPAKPVELDLGEVLEWCITQLQPRAEQRKVVLEADFEPARVVGVADHLKMLFVNLVSNAVAYSHEGGHVRVRCRSDGDGGPVVTVADDGIGIPGDKLPQIFGEYYRTKEAVRHNKESSGLGLAIVRHLAQTDGIGVRVMSQPGEGTTFEVAFGRPTAVPEGTLKKERGDGVLDDSG